MSLALVADFGGGFIVSRIELNVEEVAEFPP
jgi:hypothetical protein